MKTLHVAILVALAGLVGPSAVAQTGVPSDDSVRELLKLTGAEALGLQMLDAMIGDFAGTYPNVPEGFWKEFRGEVKSDEIVTLLVPIYQKHLTVAEVEGLIAFFSSPTGRSFVQKQPAILTDSMQAGSAWGAMLAEKVIERLKTRGHTE